MLRAIQLENFKAYGQRTTIPLAPITLLFGQNSAGKSSILHALSLLKQSRAARDPGALLLPRSDQGFVDLGSFKEMVFSHDQTRPLTIRLDIEYPRHSTRYFDAISNLGGIGIEWSFVQPRPRRGISVNQLQLFSFLDPEPLATFRSVRSSKPDGQRRKRRSRTRRDARVERQRLAQCDSITKSPIVWRPIYEFYRENSHDFLPVLQAEKQRLGQVDGRIMFSQVKFQGSEAQDALAEINRAIDFFGAPVDFDSFVERMSQEQLGTMIGFEGFIPTQNFIQPREKYVEMLLAGSEDFPHTNCEWNLDVTQIADEAGGLVDDTLRSVYPLSPFRKPPSRWYIFSGSEVRDVGFDGELLPDLLFRSPSLVKETNRWLERLETGYKLKIRGFGTQAKDLYEIRLVDTQHRRNVEVGLLDVGFGISQMLPFIVQSLAANNQIVTIEQPEIHVHPRLQADLGDLLAEAIGEPYFNQFIIETHSEHLILRLQKLVRTNKLRPAGRSVRAPRSPPKPPRSLPSSVRRSSKPHRPPPRRRRRANSPMT